MPKTNFIIETKDRELCGVIVKQRTKDEFMCLNDIIYIVDKAKMEAREQRINFDKFLQSENTKAFLRALKDKIGIEPYIKGAKNRSGWIHPFFAIKILTHYNPAFEVEVYAWLWDYLIKNRKLSADSFNKMKGALYVFSSNKTLFKSAMQGLCVKIKEIIGVEDWNKATQEQLELREYTHRFITDLTNTMQNSKIGVSAGLKALQMRVDALKRKDFEALRKLD